jgi:hypothetical protein
MRKTIISTVIMVIAFGSVVYAQSNGSTRNQREEYRDAMGRENDEDFANSVKLREERRDMLRKGVTPGQVRAQQEAEIDMRRTAHPADFGDDAVIQPALSNNSSYVGFSTPRKKAEKVQQEAGNP